MGSRALGSKAIGLGNEFLAPCNAASDNRMVPGTPVPNDNQANADICLPETFETPPAEGPDLEKLVEPNDSFFAVLTDSVVDSH